MAIEGQYYGIQLEDVERMVLEHMRHYFRVDIADMASSFNRVFRIVLRLPRGNQIGVATAIDMMGIARESRLMMDTQRAIERSSSEMVYSMMNHIETWILIAKDELKFDQILAIRDIEQRMVALKRYGVEKVLHDAKAELIEKSKRGNELFIIPRSRGIFTVDAYYLKYSCPSTGRLYISGVPPQMGETKDADACMAWKHGLSKEAYQLLNAEA